MSELAILPLLIPLFSRSRGRVVRVGFETQRLQERVPAAVLLIGAGGALLILITSLLLDAQGKTYAQYLLATEVEVDLVTGRYNQIRLHFAHHGHPLAGVDAGAHPTHRHHLGKAVDHSQLKRESVYILHPRPLV